MVIYSVIYCINLIFGILNIANKRYTKFLWIISFIILNFFLCFNYMSGMDWTAYQSWFLKLPTFGDMIGNKNFSFDEFGRNRGEPLFYYTMILFKTFGINYEIYQYFILTIFLIIIYKFLRKETNFPLFAISVYFVTYLLDNMSSPALRQIIAISFFYQSLKYLEKRKKIKYSLRNIIGFFFHNSAILTLGLLLLPLKKIKIEKVIVVIVISIFFIDLLENILSFVSHYIIYLKKYLVYFSTEKYGVTNNLNIKYFIKIVIFILMGWFVEKNKSCLKNKNSNFYMILNSYWISIVCFTLQRKLIIFMRVSEYFEIFYVIVLVWFVQVLADKYSKKIAIITSIVIGLFYYRTMISGINYWINMGYKQRYIPYSNYILEILLNDNLKKDWEKINIIMEEKIKILKKEG